MKLSMSGPYFAKLRQQLGYDTRKKIADEIGVSEEAIKSWETERSPVPLYAIKTIKRIQGLSKRQSK